ncbi:MULTISPECIES: putative Ig domain-containing protein [Microbacterium]|uniref:putative Ig domain-containing protein n=1 Tax=Microbacterium TaxID=33882 RepID=UPI001D17A068|nr:putative Ig domain-containing protein [Microbacterium testaceum]MCC4248976.1 putative Ig domain-containing protein [Microbacterium testaceum]
MKAARSTRIAVSILAVGCLTAGTVLTQASPAPAVSIVSTIVAGIGEDPTMVVTPATGDLAFIGSAGSTQVVDTDSASSTFNTVVTDLTDNPPTALAPSADGSVIYVAGAEGLVTGYASDTGATSGPWMYPDYEGEAGAISGLALSPDGGTLWASMNAFSGWSGIAALDLPSGTQAGAVYVDEFYDLEALALSPDGSLAFAVGGDLFSASLYVIDTQSFALVHSISLSGGVRPQDVAVTPDGTTVVVSNWENDTVDVVTSFGAGDTPNLATVSGVHDAQDVAISPDGYTAYVTGSDGVTAIDVRDPAAPVSGPYAAGDDPYGIAISTDGQRAYVSNEISDGTVTVLEIPAISPRSQSLSVVPGSAFATSVLRSSGFDEEPTTFTVANGGLPDGVSFDPTTGVLSGVMPSSTLTVAIDAQSGSQVAGAVLTVTAAAVPTLSPAAQISQATVGTAYASSALTPVNFLSPPTYSISPSTLPVGLGFETATGVIGGTPLAAAEPTDYTITASAGNESATATLTLGVSAIVSPATQSVLGEIGTPLSTAPLSADGFPDTAPITYSVSPALPVGLSLDPATGVVSGSPAGPLDETFTITASGSGFTATAAIDLTVPLDLVVRVPNPSYVAGDAVDQRIVEPIGFPDPVTLTASPALPAGLTLSADGTLTGRPSAAQTPVDTVITATSGTFSKTATVSIEVSAALSPAGVTEQVQVGYPLSTAPLNAWGFPASPSYTIDPQLPTGLSLNPATGSVSGAFLSAMTPVTYTITGSAGGFTATSSLTLEAIAPSLPAPGGNGGSGPDVTPGAGTGANPAPAGAGSAPGSSTRGGSTREGAQVRPSSAESTPTPAPTQSSASIPAPSPTASASSAPAPVATPAAEQTVTASDSGPAPLLWVLVALLVVAAVGGAVVVVIATRRRSA